MASACICCGRQFVYYEDGFRLERNYKHCRPNLCDECVENPNFEMKSTGCHHSPNGQQIRHMEKLYEGVAD